MRRHPVQIPAMTKIPAFWPPIEDIARDLSGRVEHDDPEISISDDSSDSLPQRISDDVRAILRRIEAARTLDSNLPPASGDLIRLTLLCTGNPQETIAKGFLLDCPKDVVSLVWEGWFVSPETDYAGPWDVLLDDRDGTVDPLAGMVQTWHRITATLPVARHVLARLSTTRMQSIRAVAAEAQLQSFEFLGAPGAGRPGLRQTLNGQSVVTGQPYLGVDDPRYRYHDLYVELAKPLLVCLYKVDDEPPRVSPEEPTL